MRSRRFRFFGCRSLTQRPLAVFTPFGGAISHLGVLVFVIAAWLTSVSRTNRIHALGLASIAWVPLLVASSVSGTPSVMLIRLWKPYQVWEFGWLVVAVGWSITRCVLGTSVFGTSNTSEALTPILFQRGREDQAAASWWSDAASVGVLLLAVREFWFHQSVACPAICVAVVAANAALLAWVNRSQWRAAASTAAVVLATAMAWTRDWNGLLPRTDQQMFWWWEACVIALALSACAWQLVEAWWQTRCGDRFDSQSRVVTACRGGDRVGGIAGVCHRRGCLATSRDVLDRSSGSELEHQRRRRMADGVGRDCDICRVVVGSFRENDDRRDVRSTVVGVVAGAEFA